MAGEHDTMTRIQVFDPPMCCSTGICGPSVDPDLVNFAAMLSQLANMGVKIERQNLGQQPMAFAKHPVVKGCCKKRALACCRSFFSMALSTRRAAI